MSDGSQCFKGPAISAASATSSVWPCPTSTSLTGLPAGLDVCCDDTYHYEELTHAAQVLILARTKNPEVASLAAYWTERLAVDHSFGYSTVLKPLRTNTGILAIAHWAFDPTLDAWTRYYNYVGPLLQMVDDPPLAFEPQLDPHSPKVSAALERFASWYKAALTPLQRAAAAEHAQFEKLIAELSTDDRLPSSP